MKNVFMKMNISIVAMLTCASAFAGGGQIGSATDQVRTITDRGMSSNAIEALRQVLPLSNSENIELKDLKCIAGNAEMGPVAECSVIFAGKKYFFSGKSALTLASLLQEMDAQKTQRIEVLELQAKSITCGEIDYHSPSTGSLIGKRSRCDGYSK